MKSKGMGFSAEALLSLLVLVLVVSSQSPRPCPNMQNLYITQLEHDLLKVWAKQWPTSQGEMVEDFKKGFRNKSGEIVVNGKSVKIGAGKGEAVSSEMHFFGPLLKKNTVVVRVFK